MTEIELENTTKRFGEEIVAVDDVSMRVHDGELVVLVGPSGSGKSTTMRMIAGLEQPTTGRIRIDGRDVTNVEPQDRNIAMVFQSFALYPHRTVRGNISFPLEARGVTGPDREDRIVDVAETLGIAELLDRKPAQLSGGQQQRVALGRAIVRDPEAFLMDEPLANLDAKLRKEMRTEVVRLQQSLGVTMIHVTHNQEEAMTMGDRVAVMDGGQIQQFAPPEETYNRPANRFVAEFIGSPSMNLVEGTVSDGMFTAADGDISVPLSAGLSAPAGQQVTMGIRPEDVNLVDTAGEHTVTDEVDVVELLGNVQIVHLTPGGQEFLAEVHPSVDVETGKTYHARLTPEKIHLFDGVDPRAERIVPEERVRADD